MHSIQLTQEELEIIIDSIELIYDTTLYNKKEDIIDNLRLKLLEELLNDN